MKHPYNRIWLHHLTKWSWTIFIDIKISMKNYPLRKAIIEAYIKYKYLSYIHTKKIFWKDVCENYISADFRWWNFWELWLSFVYFYVLFESLQVRAIIFTTMSFLPKENKSTSSIF